MLKGKRILENVCLGMQDATRDVHTPAMFHGLEVGYKTILGGGAFGVALSRRQKRWLAIATERLSIPTALTLGMFSILRIPLTPIQWHNHSPMGTATIAHPVRALPPAHLSSVHPSRWGRQWPGACRRSGHGWE